MLGEAPRLGGDGKKGEETWDNLEVTVDGILEEEAARGGFGVDGWVESDGELWDFGVRDAVEDINNVRQKKSCLHLQTELADNCIRIKGLKEGILVPTSTGEGCSRASVCGWVV